MSLISKMLKIVADIVAVLCLLLLFWVRAWVKGSCPSLPGTSPSVPHLGLPCACGWPQLGPFGPHSRTSEERIYPVDGGMRGAGK